MSCGVVADVAFVVVREEGDGFGAFGHREGRGLRPAEA